MRKIYTSAFAVALLVACGDDGGGDPDGGADDSDAAVSSADAAPAVCTELDSPVTTLSTYPAMYSGDTTGSGANLEVAMGVCTDERTYFSQAGEDQVVELTGLTPATTYAVNVTAVADISFYVATGCDDAAGGPSTGQCELFVDETEGGSEFGEFMAPDSGSVYLIIDTFYMDAAPDGTYTVEVFEPECSMDVDCNATPLTPLCNRGRCVECITAFDCTDSAMPTCDITMGACAVGYDMCTGDDGNENDDDGPAGATVVAPAVNTPDVTMGAICSAPAVESDFYEITVAEGDDRVFVLDWATAEDLDLILWDSNGMVLDTAFFAQPEVLRATDMAAGTYYVMVSQFDPPDTAAAADYTFTATVPECTTNFDCGDSNLPVCGVTGICEAGPDDCTNEDGGENGNDGPAGATDVTPTVGGMTTTMAAVCNSPAGESDFFAVTVADGDNITATLSWVDNAVDLDITAYDATGQTLGFAFYQNPEVVTLTNLPAGTHYIQVVYFGAIVTAAVDYTLTVERSAGGCTTAADCAIEHETQFFRGDCLVSGACAFIDGAGAVDGGDPCDSGDDCTSGFCSYLAFEADAAASVCTVTCGDDSECMTALGAGYACTTPFQVNTCHPTCTVNEDCGANIGSDTIDANLPWDYLTCNAGTCDI
jgi:hypothetical protein